MQLFYFEPDDTKYEASARDMSKTNMKPTRVEEEFFKQDMSVFGRDGMKSKGIFISDSLKSVEFVKAIRNSGCMNPVIVVMDTKKTDRVVELLNAGADDVVFRPFKAAEILARMNGINRRSYGHVSDSVTIGDIVAYFDGRDPDVNGQRLRLSHREHSIFSHLALQPGRVISKENLYEAVYGMSDNQPYDKVIDVYICKIRKKIECATNGHQYIETVYGRGYKLSAPEGAGKELNSIQVKSAEVV